jgi:aldehyde:ferredoxin oxidoreductase
MIDQCNDYGMDAIEGGNVLATYMEATEKGYTNGGDGLQWGDIHKMVEIVEKTAYRQGIGDVLAEGVRGTAKYFGHPEIGMEVKGQSIPAYDPRGVKGMGLGYATSNRGACHLRGYTPAAEVIGNVLGPSTISDPIAWQGKAEMNVIFQNVHTVTDCLDFCKFTTFAESLDTIAEQYEAITGVPSGPDHLLKVGERVYNLERYYNNLAGIGEGSDYLPARFTEEASTMGGSKGQVCELDLMLEEYYEKRGWINGVVTEAKLVELEIV